MKANKLDKRIIKLLNDRGYTTDEQINDFLEPNLSMLRNPFNLNNMKEATERIEEAIIQNQKIVIYGDYDCDGIMASVMLYQYFLSRSANCDVYIPNRFDDGYGLSFDMIEEVINNSKPDLIITVDLGITAVDEVKMIKEKGVDIIVTDHHEPSQVIPDCLVIDPKVSGQDYGFDGLCGAGVAFKLIHALSGVEEAIKYIDLCSVATIGDIVPLVDENRVIAKFGIDRINNPETCYANLKYMMDKLQITKVNATDISFRLVPRINASGRMSQAKKVFDFLIETNEEIKKELYQSMVEDNDIRLKSINDGVALLESQIVNVDLDKQNIIILVGEFHQGVLGILASRICHDYNRPAIIFTKNNDGTYKGSGRSVDLVDLHLALENVSSLLVKYGGHKLAVGVEVSEFHFERFKLAIDKEVKKQTSLRNLVNTEKYDIQIFEEDINTNFINQINALEPFGCKNEKPSLMFETTYVNVVQMKDVNVKHYKLTTKTGKQIVAFNADKHIDVLKSNARKHLILELENNHFKGKTYPQGMLKNVFIKEVKLNDDKEREFMLSLIDKFNSMNVKVDHLKEYDLANVEYVLNYFSKAGEGYGTIFIVDSVAVAERIKPLLSKFPNLTVSHTPLKNKQNTILISPRYVVDYKELLGYKNIVFTRHIFSFEKASYIKDFVVYVPKHKTSCNISVDGSRATNVMIYNLIKKYVSVKSNNLLEFVLKVCTFERGVSRAQVLFSLLSFIDLGFFVIKNQPEFSIEIVENPPKKDLSSSRFMASVLGSLSK